jgi:thioredoxin 1
MVAATAGYSATAPSRAEVNAFTGPAVLEFGTSWCGFCRAAQPLIAESFAAHPDLRHLKIEDGPRRLLGRSFGVKLWPTLIFLDNGKEVSRLVRPRDAQSIREELARIDAAPSMG